MQVLGGEEVVVVKNEGVQDREGLFEMDERGNAYGQVRQTPPPFRKSVSDRRNRSKSYAF